MLRFITGDEVLEEFHRLIGEGGKADIAVAFWGNGAADALKVEKGQQLRIICNPYSGACAPSEIDTIRSLVEIRTHAELHANFYITDRGVIVGSSNVSTNGLALWKKGAARGHEASIVTDDGTIISAAKSWFDKLWKESLNIEDADLENAEKLWDARCRLAQLPRVPQGGSVFDLLTKNPDVLDQIYCLAWCEGLDPGAEEIRQRDALREELEFYQPDSPFKPGSWLISCDMTGRRPKVDGYLKVPDRPSTCKSTKPNEPELYGAYPSDRIEIGGRALTLSRADTNKLFDSLEEWEEHLEQTWQTRDAVIALRDLLTGGQGRKK